MLPTSLPEIHINCISWVRGAERQDNLELLTIHSQVTHFPSSAFSSPSLITAPVIETASLMTSELAGWLFASSATWDAQIPHATAKILVWLKKKKKKD